VGAKGHESSSLTSASPICRCLVAAAARTCSTISAELAGGQHEDRLKAEVIEIGLEKRSACVFEVR
jgi:hypothetical protein